MPWDPNPLKIDNQEYAEQELNTLVKKYKENQEKKDIHFQENIEYAREQSEKASQKNKGNETVVNNSSSETVVNDTTSDAHKSLNYDQDDPWLKNKKELNNDVGDTNSNN